MTTGQRIKEARKKAGMTQSELAQKLGISYVGVSQWENDLRNPKYETLQRIAAALGVDVNWLMNGRTLEQRDQAMKDYVSRRFAEAELDKRLKDSYCSLTLDGKVKAVESVEIIAGNPLYQAQQSGETPPEAPQSTPAPQEGKDTTPAPDGAETPPESE